MLGCGSLVRLLMEHHCGQKWDSRNWCLILRLFALFFSLHIKLLDHSASIYPWSHCLSSKTPAMHFNISCFVADRLSYPVDMHIHVTSLISEDGGSLHILISGDPSNRWSQVTHALTVGWGPILPANIGSPWAPYSKSTMELEEGVWSPIFVTPWHHTKSFCSEVRALMYGW